MTKDAGIVFWVRGSAAVVQLAELRPEIGERQLLSFSPVPARLHGKFLSGFHWASPIFKAVCICTETVYD